MAVECIQPAAGITIWQGHVIEGLRRMPDKSIQCVVTSDPYWGLRDYGNAKWEGGDPECTHTTKTKSVVAKSIVSSTLGGGKKTVGHQQEGFKEVCSRCGARRVDIQVVDWPEVTYCPMAGLPEITVPAWRGAYGLEPTLEMYVGHSVLIRRELWRVMRDDATQWLNLGDSYNGSGGAGGDYGKGGLKEGQPKYPGRRVGSLKPKDLCGIPWRVALALQADGWYLRSDIIWSKPNPMPESVTDRPTRSHEYFFLLTKSGDHQYWCHEDGRGTRVEPDPDYRWVDLSQVDRPDYAEEPPNWKTETFKDEDGEEQKRWQRINLWKGHDYYYDAEAIREPWTSGREDMREKGVRTGTAYLEGNLVNHSGKAAKGAGQRKAGQSPTGRNKRSVWTVTTKPFPAAHFATFPPELPETCVLAGTSPQACPGCVAPWERRVAINYENPGNRTTNGPRSMERKHESPGFNVRLEKQVTTIGWQPTCACEKNDGSARCQTLDIFHGSGTSMEVSQVLGRDYQGCEMNPEYVQMSIRERLGQSLQPSLLGLL